MADLEGQDHGPSSSSVGDNDDDFIVYSKEGNNARWFKKEGDEVSPEDILCEVETVPLSKIKGTGSDGTIVQADIERLCCESSSGKGASAPPTSKPKDKAMLFIQYHKGECCRANSNMDYLFQIIRDADKKGLSKIADEVKSFTRKAKENSLKPRHFHRVKLGGTYGIKQFRAIINPPQSGLLAVGS
ncbi:hypothetical protein Sjap_017950 [Stephania japonica]|uniref:2-oxoacid dehydrogenase acyltransferase catalytic domain-containing protein n=1 Tax=Stephania japonica TaxID=461633 RepID=A0AAP0I776_9MAGN